MSRLHNPPNPGEVIKELCLDLLRLTVTAARLTASGSPAARCQRCSTVVPGFSQTWQFGCQRRSGARRKAGCNCNCNMICGRLSNGLARSR